MKEALITYTRNLGFLLMLFAFGCSHESDLLTYVRTEIEEGTRHEFNLTSDSTYDKQWTRQYLEHRLEEAKRYAVNDAKERVVRDSIADYGADDSNYVDLAAKLMASRKRYKEFLSGNFESEPAYKREIDRINDLLQDPPSYHKLIYTVPGDNENRKSVIWIVRLSSVTANQKQGGFISNGETPKSDTTLQSFDYRYYRSIETAINDLEF